MGQKKATRRTRKGTRAKKQRRKKGGQAAAAGATEDGSGGGRGQPLPPPPRLDRRRPRGGFAAEGRPTALSTKHSPEHPPQAALADGDEWRRREKKTAGPTAHPAVAPSVAVFLGKGATGGPRLSAPDDVEGQPGRARFSARAMTHRQTPATGPVARLAVSRQIIVMVGSGVGTRVWTSSSTFVYQSQLAIVLYFK